MVILKAYKKSRGREETRLALTKTYLRMLGALEFDWPELKAMFIVVSVRQEEAVIKESDRCV